MNTRTRRHFHTATAILSLALWLFMAAAEICTPLHAWLHGGTIPFDDDDCAIVAIAHGKIDSATCDVPIVIPITSVEITSCVMVSIFSKPVENLLSGRAPPLLPAVA